MGAYENPVDIETFPSEQVQELLQSFTVEHIAAGMRRRNGSVIDRLRCLTGFKAQVEETPLGAAASVDPDNMYVQAFFHRQSDIFSRLSREAKYFGGHFDITKTVSFSTYFPKNPDDFTFDESIAFLFRTLHWYNGEYTQRTFTHTNVGICERTFAEEDEVKLLKPDLRIGYHNDCELYVDAEKQELHVLYDEYFSQTGRNRFSEDLFEKPIQNPFTSETIDCLLPFGSMSVIAAKNLRSITVLSRNGDDFTFTTYSSDGIAKRMVGDDDVFDDEEGFYNFP